MIQAAVHNVRVLALWAVYASIIFAAEGAPALPSTGAFLLKLTLCTRMQDPFMEMTRQTSIVMIYATYL